MPILTSAACFFLINKAIYDVVPLEKIHKVTVRFSLRHGLYIEPAGDFAVDEVFVSRVKSRMQELVEEDLPIEKINVHVDEAIRFFHRVKMYDKERLFRYRRSSHVNLYSLAGFKDYHYGYMVPSTGYLKYFDILPYQEGLALILPRMQTPRTVDPFDRQDKLFHVMQDSYRWGEQMDLETVGAVNDMISAGHLQDLILDRRGPSGETDRGYRRSDRGATEYQVCYDRWSFLLRKDQLLSPAVHPASRTRTHAASDCRGRLLCRSGAYAPG